MNMIELSNVTLDYPVFSVKANSLRQAMINVSVGGKLFKNGSDTVVVRALNNLSVKVAEGERLGLYGHNGSGKTTLLRVMAGIYAPTHGVVRFGGTISSVFDVGLGMDAEATGEDNIMRLASFRGISREQVKKEFDNIAEFTELGQFLKMPVKLYSSGMVMRLAFAVATSFRPEILVLDEWMSAGDEAFMAKAATRMSSFAKDARAMVLASHSKQLLSANCDRILVLERGVIVREGTPEEVFAPAEA